MEPTATAAPETKPIITPTIGRRLWYWPSNWDRNPINGKYMHASDEKQPCDAGICYVWSDRMVNLTVTDHNGRVHQRASVKLLQGDDPVPTGDAHAQWMPFQAGQAKPGDRELFLAMMDEQKAALEELAADLKTLNEGLPGLFEELKRLQPEAA